MTLMFPCGFQVNLGADLDATTTTGGTSSNTLNIEPGEHTPLLVKYKLTSNGTISD